MTHRIILYFSVLIFIACQNEKGNTNHTSPAQPTLLDQLVENYIQMPEQEITRNVDQRVYAQYAMPTEKYSHGILGDKIEAEQLVVVVDSVFYELTLPSDMVFEDISPRLYDVDGDGEQEIITIRTHISRGAGIAIYKISEGQLEEYAALPEIGTPNRWLNIVAINDLDQDGTVELAWIQTPHIGGILKVAKIAAGTLHPIAEAAQYSNHAIGERNLCLSILTEHTNQKVFYVPDQSRNQIVGFTFKDNALAIFEEITLTVDFTQPLIEQYPFSHTLATGNNCTITPLQ